MFTRARFTLTAWYQLIIMMISITFSIAFYLAASYGITHIVAGRYLLSPGVNPDHFTLPVSLRNGLEDFKTQLRFALIIINSFIFILAGGAGYFLAGKTLKPIEESMEKQRRFVTDASHEFRTPLTALKTSIEVNMQDKEFRSPVVQDLLQRNLYQIEKLQELANRLLTLAQNQKVQNTHFSLLSLMPIIDEAKLKVTSLADAKQITIDTKIEDTQIHGEKASLLELFTILLDNAIKYSHKNSTITIRNTLSANATTIVVHDAGGGIAKKDISHIFDRFYRADASRSTNGTTGFGLG
ncbi:MAG TPA: ATP-binding protein, partial [Candidatus Saccharimonadales bacterium]|nr:ATP-binding protein [Candidatus Saccharimonadales bacterium]